MLHHAFRTLAIFPLVAASAEPQSTSKCLLQKQLGLGHGVLTRADEGGENPAAGASAWMSAVAPPALLGRVADIVRSSASAPPSPNASGGGAGSLHESLATQGREFVMKRLRTWAGGSPDWKGVHPGNALALSSRWPCKSDKWAVVTTIFPPSEAVRALGQLQGWCTVVVGDRKGPQRGEYHAGSDRVLHLSAAEQEELGESLRVIRHLPWNSFGRKNVGFLVAMSQGARVIYDVDDDNIPLAGPTRALMDLMSRPRMGARVVAGLQHANVYSMFASGAAPWPRGYPLDGISADGPTVLDEHVSASEADTGTIGVVQSLAQHNPDVDAIYRLTQKLPVTFEDRSPVVLDEGTFSPFNAQATFWFQRSFLAMLLPTSVHGRVADILRSYAAQAVLWEAGQRIAFVQPQVDVTERNPHSLLADFQAEYPLYYTVPALLRALADKRRDFGGRALQESLFEMYVYLYEYGFVESRDVLLAKAWVEDVARVEALRSHAPPSPGGSVPALVRRDPSSGAGSGPTGGGPASGHGSGVILHVHFNFPGHAASVLWFLERTSLCHPANFVACLFVSDWTAEDLDTLSTVRSSRYGVPARVVTCAANARAPEPWAAYHGYYMYQCFARTAQFGMAEAGLGAHGVLFLADDSVLLQPWPLVRDRLQAHGSMVLLGARPWNPCGANLRAIGLDDAPCGFIWAQRAQDKENILRALDSLPAAQRQRLGVTDEGAPFLAAPGDVVYLPLEQGLEFQELAQHFARHQVFEEIALPMMATALGGSHPRPEEGLQITMLWGEERASALSIVDRALSAPSPGGATFVHPVKLGMLTPQDLEVLQALYAKLFDPSEASGPPSNK